MMEGEAPLQEEAAELARHVRRVPSSTRVAVVANILAACDGLELTFLKLHLEDILARHPSAKQFQDDELAANTPRLMAELWAASSKEEALHQLALYIPHIYRTNTVMANQITEMLV